LNEPIYYNSALLNILALFYKLKKQNVRFELRKIGLQQWYNENQGLAVQTEIAQAIKQLATENV
jgi:hypothetical protein